VLYPLNYIFSPLLTPDRPATHVSCCQFLSSQNHYCRYADNHDTLNEEDPLELSGLYLVWETRIAGLQSGEGRMMIDSVVWRNTSNVTDRQQRRHSRNASVDHNRERRQGKDVCRSEMITT